MGNSTTLWWLCSKMRPGAQKNPVSHKRHAWNFPKERLVCNLSESSSKISYKINMLVDYFVLGMIIKSVWHTSCNDAGHSLSDLNNS